jgi:hypothetical protein
MLKSGNMLWVGFVARMEELRNALRNLFQNLPGKTSLGGRLYGLNQKGF